MSALDELLAAQEALRHIDAKWEIEKLRAIRAWALRQVGVAFEVGDRVELIGVPTDNGWASYREALADGATAVVRDIDFNPFSDDGRGLWHAEVLLDREWAVGAPMGDGAVNRYWHGPAVETPAGYVPPSKFDQERHPEGRKHTFSIPVKYLRPERPGGFT